MNRSKTVCSCLVSLALVALASCTSEGAQGTDGGGVSPAEVAALLAADDDFIEAVAAAVDIEASGGGVPTGTVIAYAGESPPEGWLLCDGTELLREDYPDLFDAIGTAHGSSNGFTFLLPDYRGRFLRGVDLGAGVDPDANSRGAAATGGNDGDAVGSLQGYATALPSTPFATNTTGNHNHSTLNQSSDQVNGVGGTTIFEAVSGGTTGFAGNHSHSVSDGGDAETRPANAAVFWIIKA